MSNPTAVIDFFVPHPGDPDVVRKTFTRISFESQAFFTYGEGEYDPTYAPGGSFDPSDKGERFYLWIPLEYALGGDPTPPPIATRPDFISAEAWAGLRWSPSGFVVEAVNSVLPKIIVPSDLIVDNGMEDISQFKAKVQDPVAATEKDLFDWELVDFNGGGPPANAYEAASLGSFTGTQYVTVRAKKDDRQNNEITIKLQNPTAIGGSPPLGSDHDWLLADSTNLVVGGAFCITLNIIPDRPSTAAPTEVAKNPWNIKFTFGDVEMRLAAGSEMQARIDGAQADEVWDTVNMSEAKSRGGPPQQEEVNDRIPYVIMVYPVWNGIIIQSGVQEARANSRLTTPTLASTTYVPKRKDASIWESPWSDGFDPTDPDEVEVDVDAGGSGDVTVDFGSEMTVVAQNCRFEISYNPCFFSKDLWFDEWFVTSDDIPGDVSFDYSVYPIWTANNGASVLSPVPAVTESGTVGPVDDTHYSYVKWRLTQDHFDRIPGQIFGSILEIEESRLFAVKNENGNFNLAWAGGTPADPAPADWRKYVQSISVQTGLDGSSGTVTVDKYGVAGQEAEAFQSVGAFTIEMDGGFGTEPGIIFEGLALGVGDNRSASGATWNIPLVGLEKKMDDIALINVPFLDGESLGNALNFLTRYAGIVSNLAAANPFIDLSVSEDINVARFDWKSGTSVRTAIEDCMKDTNHAYVVQQGQIQFYQLDNNGLPVTLGFNWQPTYPSTKTVTTDQTPDFEDLRNEIVVIGLEEIFDGQNTNLESIPTVPRFEIRENFTVPDVPWAKSIVEVTPGFLTLSEIEDYADQIQKRTNHYESIGRTTVPGNANIHVYDRWGSAVIFSVSHNIDFNSKTWTTDLEFSEV